MNHYMLQWIANNIQLPNPLIDKRIPMILTPYQRELLDTCNQMPPTIFRTKDRQVGATSALLAWSKYMNEVENMSVYYCVWSKPSIYHCAHILGDFNFDVGNDPHKDTKGNRYDIGVFDEWFSNPNVTNGFFSWNSRFTHQVYITSELPEPRLHR